MSEQRYAIVPAAALLDKRLNPRDITVLCALGQHTDKHGWCKPSYARIGKMLGVSRQSVSKSVARLQEAGYVETRKRIDPDTGSQTSNLTRVVMDTKTAQEHMRDMAKKDATPATTADAPRNHSYIPPATPEVSPPATPEVSLTTPVNDPSEVGDTRASKTRRTQLPKNFYPNATGVQKAEAAGLSVAVLLQAFADYHRARGNTMADWQAAWRTWVTNAVRFAARDKRGGESFRERDKRMAAERMAEISPRIADWSAIDNNVIDMGEIQNAKAIAR